MMKDNETLQHWLRVARGILATTNPDAVPDCELAMQGHNVRAVLRTVGALWGTLATDPNSHAADVGQHIVDLLGSETPAEIAIDLLDKMPDVLGAVGGELTDYVANGTRPGRFVECALSNDLAGVVATGWTRVVNVPELVAWIHANCPAESFGTSARVQSWVNRHGLRNTPPTERVSVGEAMRRIVLYLNQQNLTRADVVQLWRYNPASLEDWSASFAAESAPQMQPGQTWDASDLVAWLEYTTDGSEGL